MELEHTSMEHEGSNRAMFCVPDSVNISITDAPVTDTTNIAATNPVECGTNDSEPAIKVESDSDDCLIIESKTVTADERYHLEMLQINRELLGEYLDDERWFPDPDYRCHRIRTRDSQSWSH